MKGYKRLTNEDLVVTLNYNNSYENMSRFLGYAYSLWNLENSIEKGEIDYVADRDKEIARLTEENKALQKRIENAVELPCKVGDSVLYVFINTVPDDDYYCSFHIEPCIRTVSFRLEYLYEWGKNYFLNTEEGMLAAKSRLEELKGGRQE